MMIFSYLRDVTRIAKVLSGRNDDQGHIFSWSPVQQPNKERGKWLDQSLCSPVSGLTWISKPSVRRPGTSVRRPGTGLLGDHFEVAKANAAYCKTRAPVAREIRPAGLLHLQPPGRPGRLRPHRRAPSDDPARLHLGDGDPEGVRQRAAKEMIASAQAAKRLGSTSSTVSPAPPSGLWSTPSRRCRRR